MSKTDATSIAASAPPADSELSAYVAWMVQLSQRIERGEVQAHHALTAVAIVEGRRSNLSWETRMSETIAKLGSVKP